MCKVIYLNRSQLGPKFGYAVPSMQVIYVRDDLPCRVKEFVLLYEEYHPKDNAKWWVWRELKASAAGAMKEPLGFSLCVLMSLAPSRLRYYWKRIRGMDKRSAYYS